tara:strand:- start:917 stop:1711 length:795 start_codon:yes stop_codon:yes gene_type:complete
MKEYIEYIFLALIQGITEFLPVSSSGHIEFLKHIINNSTIQKEGAFITVILHLATALSIIVIFREKLKNLLFRHNSESKNYILKVLVSMIPVAILVLFNVDQNIEDKYNEGWGLIFIGLMFLITAIILFFTEKISIKTKNITYIAALIIGIAQAIAILPGISRSGLTICCALLLGATKKEASTFSFLICLPIILGKSFKDLVSFDILQSAEFNFPILIAFIFTFFIGLVCCKWMIKIVDQSKLKYFGIYCFFISMSAFLFNILS